MDPNIWVRNYYTYVIKSEEIAAGEAVKRHLELGKWAWDHGLEDEAWEQWIAVISRDPDNLSARRAMGFVKENGQWARPGRINPQWIRKVNAAGRAYSFTVAIEDDAEAPFFEEFSWRLQRLNWFIWDITAGQVYLKHIIVRDNSSKGRFVIERHKLNAPLLEGGGAVCYNAGRPDWVVASGGRCYVRILCHEFFHGIFGLPDERHGCACLMQGGLYGIKTDQLFLCDRDTHLESDRVPVSCWDIILHNNRDMVHPNKADYGRAPDVEIDVVDT